MSPDRPKGPGKSIVAAVGRSGTTIIHKLLLDIYADCYGNDFDCLYEPFVWDSARIGHYPRDAARESQFGNRDALSEEGLYHHTKLPLFTAESEPEQPGLAAYLKSDTQKPLLAKFIRANGRLNYLDRLYPDGRFIVTLRNPLDVVNSVVTKFSFFGAEFHKNDYPRFRQDVARLYGVELPAERELPNAYKAALWCHFMNLAAMRHALGKPNYKIIVYEDFNANREAYTRLICDHIGAAHKPAYDNATASSVGRVTKGAPALSDAEVEAIKPLVEEYMAMIEQVPKLSVIDKERILQKYRAAKPGAARHERGLGWSPVKLESELFSYAAALQETQRSHRMQLAEAQRRTLAAEAAPVDADIPISVVVTSFNNAGTIRQTLDSILHQSYPVAEIIVADDGSSDGSQDLLKSYAAAHPAVRVIPRERNIGVSANRNDAVRQAASAFVSQIDGDDAFHPEKLQREARALQGRSDAVAFSDTLKLDPEDYWDCSWFTGLSGRTAVAGMLSRRGSLPRDMLLSKALFQEAGGYREDIAIYEDWGFKIRLAEKARHWLYAGGPGTRYRPGGLSRVSQVHHLHGALWILCHDAGDVIERSGAQVAAYLGLLRIMKVEANPRMFDQMSDLLAQKIAVAFESIKRNLLSQPASAYVGREEEFLRQLQRALSIVGG
jgi:glycosyltransferase involved in cell wall biosynthesis